MAPKGRIATGGTSINRDVLTRESYRTDVTVYSKSGVLLLAHGGRVHVPIASIEIHNVTETTMSDFVPIALSLDGRG